ncbi:hypothetical protein QV13_23350 [Mesorhizobium hungaricum]|uniref:Uncharacterized protein n=1 Tax=Mesorhizobium hungaricum TaxID=1566387 RepID=A0A1C2DD37_9HYPH|nr:hypothetical protein QV13_23350 [Mesorhizobium hungaricum]
MGRIIECPGEIVPDIRAVPIVIGRDIEKIRFQEQLDGDGHRMQGLIVQSATRRPLSGFNFYGGIFQENLGEYGVRTCGDRKWRQSWRGLRYAMRSVYCG